MMRLSAAFTRCVVSTAAAAPTFKPGKFNCYIYLSRSPILADTVTFAPGGTYTTRGGGAKTGKYEFDSKSSKVKVSGGPLEGADLPDGVDVAEEEERRASSRQVGAQVITDEPRLATERLELLADAAGHGAETFGAAGGRLDLDELAQQVSWLDHEPAVVASVGFAWIRSRAMSISSGTGGGRTAS